MTIFVLFLILAVALTFGRVTHRRFGLLGWSPAGVIAGILVVLYIAGAARLHW
jgi:uncharacterized transporter YbjL